MGGIHSSKYVCVLGGRRSKNAKRQNTRAIKWFVNTAGNGEKTTTVPLGHTSWTSCEEFSKLRFWCAIHQISITHCYSHISIHPTHCNTRYWHKAIQNNVFNMGLPLDLVQFLNWEVFLLLFLDFGVLSLDARLACADAFLGLNVFVTVVGSTGSGMLLKLSRDSSSNSLLLLASGWFLRLPQAAFCTGTANPVLRNSGFSLSSSWCSFDQDDLLLSISSSGCLWLLNKKERFRIHTEWLVRLRRQKVYLLKQLSKSVVSLIASPSISLSVTKVNGVWTSHPTPVIYLGMSDPVLTNTSINLGFQKLESELLILATQIYWR